MTANQNVESWEVENGNNRKIMSLAENSLFIWFEKNNDAAAIQNWGRKKLIERFGGRQSRCQLRVLSRVSTIVLLFLTFPFLHIFNHYHSNSSILKYFVGIGRGTRRKLGFCVPFLLYPLIFTPRLLHRFKRS